MTGATPGCEPLYFNLFVFVGGVFAGTVSPVMMAPTRDGAAGAVRITGADTLTVEFARYMPGDSECCPSSRVRVSYRIERERRRSESRSDRRPADSIGGSTVMFNARRLYFARFL